MTPHPGWFALALMLVPSTLLAQAPPPAPPAPAPAPPPPPPPAPPATPTPAPPASAPPPAPPAPASPPPPEAPAAPAAAPAEAAAAPAKRWYDAITLGAFVDAYGSVNYNFPRPQTTTAGLGGNQFRAFDVTNGFAVHWLGLDASYAPDPIGGVVSLRLGPAAQIYNATDAPFALQLVKQAYASWKPGGASGTVTLDFGKWDQPYGSEVADTQGNIMYTRSMLFWYAQPLYFTGLRFDWAASESLDLKLFAANGWNESVSVNRGKTVGLQVNYKPSASSLISAGYTVGPQQVDTIVASCAAGTAPDATGACVASAGAPASASAVDVKDAVSRLKHLADLVVDVTVAEKLRFLLNGDFGAEDRPSDSTATFYGVNLAVRYALSDAWSIAVRGEWFADPQGWATQTLKKGTTFVDGTLTLGWSPTPNFIVKLEPRFDWATTDAKDSLFQTNLTGTSQSQVTTLLGVVAKTN